MQSGAQLKRSLDQQRRGQGLWTGLDLDILPDVLGNSVARILVSALEALRISKQNRLFDLLRLKLDIFDFRPEAFGSFEFQAPHVLPDVPQWTDNMVLPGKNVAYDLLDIVTIE